LPAATPFTPERWQQIEAVFHQALETDPPGRPELLERLCGTDSELRREVESLLSSLDAAPPVLESTVRQVAESYLNQRSPASAPAPVAEGDRVDHYIIRAKLGAGGMGEVYLAEDSRLKRKVALKMLPAHLIRDPLALRRFEQEAQVLSGLNQPNLLTVFEFCHFENRHFLVTEFIEGETLRQILDRGALPRAQALDIAIQIASALQAAHASGVIHRDIKPENVIVRPDGWVKLLDFGIAKLAEPQPGSLSGNYTVPGAILGTPRYMSPEQARGAVVDARTDLFSLGAVLYEMLTGKPPFSGETHSELIAGLLLNNPALLPPGTPKALQAILNRALAKDPAQRFQTAADLLLSLKQVRDSENPARSRPVLLWTALGSAIAAILLAGWFLVAPSLRPPAPNSPRTLAVLPFRNLKPDPATDFLGVSLADEVTAKLGYVKALAVRATASVNKYRDGGTDLRRVASELNTDLLLTGTISRMATIFTLPPVSSVSTPKPFSGRTR
jgi:serine/threonine protein kinase